MYVCIHACMYESMHACMYYYENTEKTFIVHDKSAVVENRLISRYDRNIST